MEGKIRVLYINSHKDLGGSSQSLLDMIDSLPGVIEPIILTTQRGELSRECERRGYKCLIHKYTDLACLAHYSKKHLLIHPFHLPIIQYLYHDVRCLFFLFSHLGRKEIDIVHSNISGCTVGVLISRFWGVPHVWHIREAIDIHFQSRICMGMNRLKRLINLADARIAISQAVKEHHSMPEKGTYVINDAVRNEDDIVFIPQKDKFFLFASFGITEAKGAPLAVSAFGQSHLYDEGYRLKIVGHCDERMHNHLIQVAEQFGGKSNIDFIPFQQDVKPYFEHASAFIQASIFEGLGRTTAEAMFFGCPVIATSYSGGTLDLIEDKKTGYLFDSSEQCAELLKKVCRNDQTEIIKNAHEYALAYLSHKVFGPKLFNVYKTVIHRNE